MTRFHVKHVIIKKTALYTVKSKPWYAQKIAAVLRETFVPKYPQEPVNILHAPSYQVNIVTEPDVQQKTAKAAVTGNYVM